MTDVAEKSAVSEWRDGWGVVFAGAMGMALASLSVYAMGVFIVPLEQEFGWSRAQISAGMTLSAVIAVISAPFVGLAVDRFGARRIGVVGVIAYCACFSLFAFTGPSIWSWWGLWLLFALAALGIKPTVWTTGVSSLFSSGRGMAISVMLCGTGLGSSLTPVVSNYLIEAYGWRWAFAGIALFWAILVLPPVAIFFTSAKDRHRRAGHSAAKPQANALTGVGVREGLLSWKFARLASAAFLATLVIVSFVSNLVPILTDSGLTRQEAANIAGLVGITTIIGRLTGGFLLDRINGSLVGGVSLLMPLVSCILLISQPGSASVAVFAVFVLGFSLGAELDAVAYLSTRHFGMRNFGVLFGTISGLLALATGLGPFLVSYAYDVTGSYRAVLVAYAPLCVVTSLLFFTLGRYPVFAAPVVHGEAELETVS